jgi:MFS transporter, ACS family, D-galactonate transporter
MSGAGTARGAWLTVILLFLFMVVNFADKAVIGLAGVPIMQELQLSPRQFGLIGSSFFLLFAVSAIITGFIANRVQTRWLLLVMGLVWALSQFPMLGAAGFGTILVCRVVLGAGEGPAHPVALHATYKWFPNELRTLPTAIVTQGGAIGVMVSLPLLNWVIVHYSWHWAFGALAIVGLFWTGLWLAFGREGTIADRPAPGATAAAVRVPYRQLLASPTILAGWCAAFGAYWGLTLALTWQGPFLVKGLGIPQQDIGLLAALSPALSVIAMVGGGWLSQRLMARGVSSRVARGLLGGGFVAIGGTALVALPTMPTIGLQIAMTVIGTAFPTLIYVIWPSVAGEITPPAQRGALLAIGTAISTSAGLLAPFIMGSVIESAASPLAGYYAGYELCGLIMLVGGAIGMALMRPEREAERWARDGADGALPLVS